VTCVAWDESSRILMTASMATVRVWQFASEREFDASDDEASAPPPCRPSRRPQAASHTPPRACPLRRRRAVQVQQEAEAEEPTGTGSRPAAAPAHGDAGIDPIGAAP
jgi:hypothetical protein